MSNKKREIEENKIETFEKLHSKKPMTRRDFLATGLLPFAASMLAPSVLQVLTGSSAFAADSRCEGGNATGLPGFINLNLSGGSGLFSHAIALDAAGQMLPSYTRMGLGLGSRVPTVREFGNSLWYRDSSLLRGLKSTCSAETMAKVSFISVAVESRDDTSDNKMDISGLIDKVRSGSLLPTLNPNRNKAAFGRPKPAVSISRFTDINNAILLGGSVANSLNQQQETRLLKMVSNLSNSQSRKLASFTGGAELQNLISCAGIKNVDLISKNELGTDPLTNSNFARAWNINNNTADNNQDKVFGSLTYNVLQGNASMANLSLGGYDYHNGTRTSGDTRDETAGQVIGKILESAAALGQKLFLTVTTDGAVTSSQSEDPGAAWVSDGGNKGFWYILAFDPAGRPSVKRNQLGAYTSGQVVDKMNPIGSASELGSAGIFANYLSFAGILGQFETVAGRGIFSAKDLEDLALFG